MKEIRWGYVKSRRLKKTRGISFEEIVEARLVDILVHPNRDHQSIMLFYYKRYMWVVPFVETDKELFLKTVYPSRKYTKSYFKKRA